MRDRWSELQDLTERYIDAARAELAARWEHWALDLMRPELHEVVGALLARQVTLATQIARSPGIWNGHIAPVLLRTMTDVHINLAWILKDPGERTRKFVLYGLGQQKLIMEHRRAHLQSLGRNPEDDPDIASHERWLNSQRFSFLTEVNVGNWSGMAVREMAEAADCLDLYHLAYTPLSAATHSAWHHVSRYNLQNCENPLHRFHQVPMDREFHPDCDYLCLAAKYLDKSLTLFDQSFSVTAGVPSAFDSLIHDLENLDSSDDEPPVSTPFG